MLLNNKHIDELLLSVKSKNQNACSELYKLTSPAVYAYAMSFLKNTYDAEDVMHDCYVNIFSAADKYVSQGQPMAWILTIVKNLSLQKLNSAVKANDLSVVEKQLISPDSNLDTESKMLISMCFVVLDSFDQRIVILYAVAGFKHREISSALNIPLNSELSRYSRALKKLKSEYEGIFSKEDQ